LQRLNTSSEKEEEMQEEYGQIPGGTISGELLLCGQMTGDAEVLRGAHLILNGQVTGTLTINEGGLADINGMVVGDLVNHGTAVIAGTMTGALHDESGSTLVQAGAHIGGR
jgi:hypothetical protein